MLAPLFYLTYPAYHPFHKLSPNILLLQNCCQRGGKEVGQVGVDTGVDSVDNVDYRANFNSMGDRL